MNRVEVTRPYMGLIAMQVCAVVDATDEEILEVCNRENPSGTTNGWGKVVRSETDGIPKEALPLPCSQYPERVHFIVYC